MADVILTGKQAAFVDAYVANLMLPPDQQLTGRQIAAKAGVADKSAENYAALALTKPNVQAAIAERKREVVNLNDTLARLGVDASRVLTEWAQIATADPTEVISVRRINCRHCYGVNHHYQFTDVEFAREAAHSMQNDDADMTRYEGGGGFEKLRDPNPKCPECAGEGVADIHIRDIRKLKPAARRLIAGVKQGRYGIEVLFRDQDAALLNLAKFLGVYVERRELAGPNGGPIPVANVNYQLPSDPAEAARVYQQLMGVGAK